MPWSAVVMLWSTVDHAMIEQWSNVGRAMVLQCHAMLKHGSCHGAPMGHAMMYP